MVNEAYLKHPAPVPPDNLQLKTSCKEDEDFVIVNDETWRYLHGIYGGVDVPRFSISVSTDPDVEKEEFMIEIFFKKL